VTTIIPTEVFAICLGVPRCRACSLTGHLCLGHRSEPNHLWLC